MGFLSSTEELPSLARDFLLSSILCQLPFFLTRRLLALTGFFLVGLTALTS